MRKFSAILLMNLFVFSQYARQLSYLECKFSNGFKPDAIKCDCAKKAGLDKKDYNQSPLSKVHTHVHPDEFFSAVREINIDSFVYPSEANPGCLHKDDECEGNYSKPWQPPNA